MVMSVWSIRMTIMMIMMVDDGRKRNKTSLFFHLSHFILCSSSHFLFSSSPSISSSFHKNLSSPFIWFCCLSFHHLKETHNNYHQHHFAFCSTATTFDNFSFLQLSSSYFFFSFFFRPLDTTKGWRNLERCKLKCKRRSDLWYKKVMGKGKKRYSDVRMKTYRITAQTLDTMSNLSTGQVQFSASSDNKTSKTLFPEQKEKERKEN